MTARCVVRFVVALTFVAGLFVVHGAPASLVAAYEYDATATVAVSTQKPSSAATTPIANTRTEADGARSSPRTLSRSSTSSLGRFLAAKGGRLADDVPASMPVGRRGRPMDVRPGTNAPGEIGGRPYSGHALDRMQGRGIPPSAVEDAIASGQAIAGRAGTTIHYSPGNHISVVVGRDGRVVTVGYGRFK